MSIPTEKDLSEAGVDQESLEIEDSAQESFYVASQWKLIWWKFLKHKLSNVAGVVLMLMYLIVVFCEILSPHTPLKRFPDYLFARPTRIHLFHEGKLVGPFVYGLKKEVNVETFRRYFVYDKTRRYPLKFWVRGEEYKMWGVFKMKIHLFGTEGSPVFLFGTDRLGQQFSI